jgi:hypothetical protein
MRGNCILNKSGKSFDRSGLAVIFIGPQGSGKTTRARLLVERLYARGVRACVIKMVDYTVFHLWFIRFINLLVRDNVVLVRFYENLSPQRSASPNIFERLLPILALLHILGLILSLIKLMALRALRRCEVIVDDEGFVFKQLSDFYYLAVSVSPGITSSKLSSVFLRVLLTAMIVVIRGGVIVHVSTPYEVLVERYKRRGVVEPRAYIEFQEGVYNTMRDILYSRRGCECHYVTIDDRENPHKSINNIIYTILKT